MTDLFVIANQRINELTETLINIRDMIAGTETDDPRVIRSLLDTVGQMIDDVIPLEPVVTPRQPPITVRLQRVHLGRLANGAPGLFTGNTLAIHLEETEVPYAAEVAKRCGFEFEG
jgi:hypothetical protein